MPGYIHNVLMKFQHAMLKHRQDALHKHIPIHYGQTVQYAIEDDPLLTLPEAQIKQIQAIIGCLLYYARHVDPAILVVVGTIVAVQNQGTQNTADAMEHLLDYCASHPDTVIWYCPSNMILKVHSDASYLSEPKVHNRAGGYFYLGNQQPQHMNGPILVLLQTLRNIMASAADTELGTLFENTKKMVSLHTTLNSLGHQQPATLIQVDNSTTHRI
eukprot:10904410-Ditylum_brightwellii.AAC.1